MTVASERPGTTTRVHPLDPLDGDEIARAVTLLREQRAIAPTARFVYVTAVEPEPDWVAAFQPGDGWDRQAFVMLRERAERATYEAVVSLSRGEVLSYTPVPDVQAPITLEEFVECERVVREDPRWQEAMRRRGVEDPALAMVDPWASGYTGAADAAGRRRLARPLTFVRGSGLGPEDNGYARPVEGLICTVDMDTMEVLEVADHGVVPLPPRAGNYLPELVDRAEQHARVAGPGEPLKPLEITQPQGSSVSVHGREVSWANWRLRVGWTPREGLVLHQVGWHDGTQTRPVLHRASLSEMYVPYGDPAPTHRNKNVFDEGEYGLGAMANPLALGCDCLGEITYLDGWVVGADGEPVRMANAICLHEEDAGIGWKHTDWRTERPEVRRTRRLVISFIATVGNYEYGFYWYLGLDGSIAFEVKLTGILSTGAVPQGETPEFGTLVAPGLYGPNHQHFFNVRLHMAVDGGPQDLYEVGAQAVPLGSENPHGNAWQQQRVHLRSEAAAIREADPLAGRAWTVASSEQRNALGSPTGYTLVPEGTPLPLFHSGSQQHDRGRFATKHLWATPYDPTQRHAAGTYVAQQPGGDGLPAYTTGDRSLERSDLVLWHTFCAHHVVRPEDWPVMPVSRVGFHLRPTGFFDANPLLELPPEQACHESTPHQSGR